MAGSTTGRKPKADDAAECLRHERSWQTQKLLQETARLAQLGAQVQVLVGSGVPERRSHPGLGSTTRRQTSTAAATQVDTQLSVILISLCDTDSELMSIVKSSNRPIGRYMEEFDG